MTGLTRIQGFDLRTGSLVIGALGVIDAVMKILYSVDMLYDLHSRELPCGEHCVATPAVVVAVSCLSLSVLHLLASSLLLHGVLKRRPGFLYPARFKLMFDAILWLSVAAHEMVQQTYPVRWFSVAVPLLMGAAISVSFYLVVRSYQFQLQWSVKGFSHERLVEEEPQAEIGITTSLVPSQLQWSVKGFSHVRLVEDEPQAETGISP